ncbi:hypothetical protein DTO027B5_1961 [Paecilomyces variotii]|nr:hypothetical protein DTO169C6_943 [Paecilomyces variotii]KAJ9287546.1 hypothetical protein DTO021C3_4839 [Paecilomyces variotii]KAJ9327573.1 hypothetical protein DTO027B3_1795 [Paecilomyces variotii]KAJ9336280.1 hypothetical protein DTO027B5_1961 [Paecilomyces variotii]
MNWTGGRLQRHSHNKPGSRSRRQKQHFAKARLKVQKESHQQDNTPFSSLPAWNQLPATGKGDQEHSHVPCSRESDSRYISQRRANSSEEPGRSGDSQTRKGTDGNITTEHPASSSRLDILKQKLLQKNDWVTVSVTRPLKMSYVSAEEREKVGRRRKITDDDRKRQKAPAQRVISPEFYTRKRRKLDHEGNKTGTPRDINITIRDYRPDTAPLSTAAKLQHSQQSSESMLLDREERHIPSSIVKARERSRRRTQQYRAADQSSLLLGSADHEMDGTKYTPSSAQNHQRHSISDDIYSKYTSSRKLVSENGYESDGYSSVASEPADTASTQNSPCVSRATGRPVCNRFTIDDQVLAEREGRLNISSLLRNDDRQSSISRDRSNLFSPFLPSQISDDRQTRLSVTDRLSFSSNQQSGRLPAVKQKIFRPLGTGRVSSESADHSHSPVKFFGQSPQDDQMEDGRTRLAVASSSDLYDRFPPSGQNGPQNLYDYRSNELRNRSHRELATSPMAIPAPNTFLRKHRPTDPHKDTWINNRFSSKNNHHQREATPHSLIDDATTISGNKQWDQSSSHEGVPEIYLPSYIFADTNTDTNAGSPVTHIRNEKTASPRLLLHSSGINARSCSTDRLSMLQSQPNTSSVPIWSPFSPGLLSMTASQQEPQCQDDSSARFENIHAENVEKVPVFKKPFRR